MSGFSMSGIPIYHDSFTLARNCLFKSTSGDNFGNQLLLDTDDLTFLTFVIKPKFPRRIQMQLETSTALA